MAVAADVGMAGMDPLHFLNTEDPTEALVMTAIAKRWFERRKQLDENLAYEIIKLLGQSMRG